MRTWQEKKLEQNEHGDSVLLFAFLVRELQENAAARLAAGLFLLILDLGEDVVLDLLAELALATFATLLLEKLLGLLQSLRVGRFDHRNVRIVCVVDEPGQRTVTLVCDGVLAVVVVEADGL